MERNFERDLNGMAAEREHNLEEYYAYMAVRVLDGCGAGPCDVEPCVFHFLDSYECTIYVKSEQLEGSYWIRADGGAGLVELRLFRGAHQRRRRYASLQHRFLPPPRTHAVGIPRF